MIRTINIYRIGLGLIQSLIDFVNIYLFVLIIYCLTKTWSYFTVIYNLKLLVSLFVMIQNLSHKIMLINLNCL